MSDNLRRYCAIWNELRQLCPSEPTGNHARHLKTLALMVSGIIGGRKTNLPSIATNSPGGPIGGKRESRTKRFERFVRNQSITAETYYLPYARALLASLPDPLVLVMDASEVGRGCLALMVGVVFAKRALPLCYLVVRRPSGVQKGDLSEETHLRLLREVHTLLTRVERGQQRGQEPRHKRTVVFLGDGEFDGVNLLGALAGFGWHFVCRTCNNMHVNEGGEAFNLRWLNVEPGDCIELPDVFFTKRGFGPVLVGAVWERGAKEPLFLVTNLELLEEACHFYRMRFSIETLFSDQKSRGFYLSHSHLSDPNRLARLMMACCLAYLWMVFLGAYVKEQGWLPLIHRTNRCDLSLFQIGLLWLEHCLDAGTSIPVVLTAPSNRPRDQAIILSNSVR